MSSLDAKAADHGNVEDDEARLAPAKGVEGGPIKPSNCRQEAKMLDSQFLKLHPLPQAATQIGPLETVGTHCTKHNAQLVSQDYVLQHCAAGLPKT